MSVYGERDAERHIALIKSEGNWIAPDTEGEDPMWTLVKRFGRAEVDGAQVLSSPSTTLYTPASGQAVRLKWIFLAIPEDGTATIATVKIGTGTRYIVPLGVFMRTSIRDGLANEALSVELSPAATVYVNYELEEFAP